MLQRWGILNWNSFVSCSAACPVMVFRHVRNGTSSFPFLIERQIAVHHGAEADGADGFERDAVLLQHFAAELPKAFLQARPNVFEMVGPDAVFVPVFPLVASRGDGGMILADQYRLDPGRAELNAQRGLAALNGFLNLILIHARLL